jgi:hypothetical protein
VIRQTTSNQMVGACGAVGATSVTAGVRNIRTTLLDGLRGQSGRGESDGSTRMIM